MSTGLAKYDEGQLASGLSGDRKAIAATVDRMKTMGIVPINTPDEAAWGLAQICNALDLNPITGEAYLAKFGGKHVPMVGTMGYEKEARAQAEFHYNIEGMDDVELSAHLGNAKSPDDVGVKITLWNYKKARECKDIGIPYMPAKSYGIFQKGDNIPKTWTKVMVAEKRAIRNVLKRDFSFRSFEKRMQDLGGIVGDEFDSSTYTLVENIERQENVRTAPIDHGQEVEEDDGITVAVAKPVRQAPSKPYAPSNVVELDAHEAFNMLPEVDSKPGPDSLEEVDELQGGEADIPFTLTDGVDTEEEQAIAEDPMSPYYGLFNDPSWDMPDYLSQVITVIRRADNGKPCTKPGYGKLVGEFKRLGITDDARYKACAVMFGRLINSNNYPSSDAAKSLYQWLRDDDKNVHYLITEEIPSAISTIIGDGELQEA